jgi:hypothetical protein
LDWKDRQLEVNITASVFILNLDVSIEELSQSEKLMATALFLFRLIILKSLINKKINKNTNNIIIKNMRKE